MTRSLLGSLGCVGNPGWEMFSKVPLRGLAGDREGVENLTVDGAPSIASVYHLDVTNLRMTHYCSTQNQPRLKANQMDLAKGTLDFNFVDVTNLCSSDAPHVYALQMRLLSSDRTTLAFLFMAVDKRSKKLIDLLWAAHVPIIPRQEGN